MAVRMLAIDRFRGVANLEWRPNAGMNCLIGAGDVGKSTVLAALALALEARTTPTASEFDYYARSIENGFEIRVVLDAAPELVETMRVAPLRGWSEGQLTPIPENGAAAVLELVVQAGSDME